MTTEKKVHDGIVLCKDSAGILQAWGYTRKSPENASPPVTGIGGHVDDEPAFLLDFKKRERTKA